MKGRKWDNCNSIINKYKKKIENLRAARERQRVSYKGVPIRLSADFSKETLQARRVWQEVLQVMKGKGLHPRLFYAAKLSFRMGGQIKCFPDKVKLKQFIITKNHIHYYMNIKGSYLQKRSSKL